MNSTLYTAALTGLALMLVAMFGFGFYWLATKDRPAQPATPTPPPSPASVPVDEFDEWEAFAPYPDHVVHAAREASAESGDSYPPFGRREEFAHASPAPEACHDLHDAIESLMGEPVAQREPIIRPAAPSSGPTHRCPRCLSSRIDTRMGRQPEMKFVSPSCRGIRRKRRHPATDSDAKLAPTAHRSEIQLP
ncbi:hypothetical protein [Burkholderia diffusa]|uniref:hypothetical protein n=1 Tax=Burkholderia diffusa TaxID=488732 RepID=UPI00157B82EA|nr:hypothetical protein [Burkholderia diffusa]NTY37826.1 hypothetical protein [Burkholderia diffusa]